MSERVLSEKLPHLPSALSATDSSVIEALKDGEMAATVTIPLGEGQVDSVIASGQFFDFGEVFDKTSGDLLAPPQYQIRRITSGENVANRKVLAEVVKTGVEKHQDQGEAEDSSPRLYSVEQGDYLFFELQQIAGHPREQMEAGRLVAVHTRPDADLFSLAAEASFSDLLEALNSSPAHGGAGENVPDRASQIAHLIVSRTVGIIRLGSQSEIADAGLSLAQLVVKHHREEYTGGLANEEALRLVSGASVVVGAAGSPSPGYELNMLRRKADGEWPVFTKALKLIDEASQGEDADGITISEISTALGIEENTLANPFFPAGFLDHLYKNGLIHAIDNKLIIDPRKAKVPRIREILDVCEIEETD